MSYEPETMCLADGCIRVARYADGLCVGHRARRRKGRPLTEKPLRDWAGSDSARSPLHGPPVPEGYMVPVFVRIRARHTCKQCAHRFNSISPSHTTFCSKRCRKAWSWKHHSPGTNRKAQRAVNRRRRRALEVGARTERIVAADLYARWEDADLYGCIYCGAPWEHHDHYVSLSSGGPHSMSNLVPACGPCNTSKSSRDAVEWFFSVGPGAQTVSTARSMEG